MRELNIQRLVDSSPYSDDLPYEVREAIADFIGEGGYTLDTINIDDFIVNGLRVVSEKEYEDYIDDYYLLIVVDEDYYVLQ